MQIEHLRVERLPPRKAEQLPRQAFAPANGAFDRFDRPLWILVLPKQLEVAADDHQQIVEIVGDASGQLPDRLQPLSFVERLLDPPLIGRFAYERQCADAFALAAIK